MRAAPTTATIMALHPCYDRDQVVALRKQHRTFEAAMFAVPPSDALWLLRKLMTARQLRVFARRCALSVAGNWDCPEVVLAYLKTGRGRSAAAEAARSAASAAAEAARSAARSAAWAARSAAGSAAESAAWSAWSAEAASGESAAWSATFAVQQRFHVALALRIGGWR